MARAHGPIDLTDTDKWSVVAALATLKNPLIQLTLDVGRFTRLF